MYRKQCNSAMAKAILQGIEKDDLEDAEKLKLLEHVLECEDCFTKALHTIAYEGHFILPYLLGWFNDLAVNKGPVEWSVIRKLNASHVEELEQVDPWAESTIVSLLLAYKDYVQESMIAVP